MVHGLLKEIFVHFHTVVFGSMGLILQEKLFYDNLELLNIVIEVSLGV